MSSGSLSSTNAVRVAARANTLEDGQPEAAKPPAGLTRAEWTQIRRSVQVSEYHASRLTGRDEVPVLQAPNRKQAYRTTFRREGIEIVPQAPAGASWRLGVSVTGYGYEGDVRPLQSAEPQANKERVEYRRGPVTEWYVNGPGGLEQGFQLDEPQPRRPGPLVLAMAVQGDLDVSAGGDGVSFRYRSGETLVRYAGLKAWDAEGHPLRSRLEAVDREVRLVVEAQAARFPVTVDPTFVHEAQLFASDGTANDGFGSSVSVSGDTAVVGAWVDGVGSAYVFVRSGTAWSHQQKLLHGGAANYRFGESVSTSGDTVVVGGERVMCSEDGCEFQASAVVFVRSGTTWTQQQILLSGQVSQVFGTFGTQVSLSGDTVVIGASAGEFGAGFGRGLADVFVRSGTTWTLQQRLLASDGMFNDQFGSSVSLSGDTAVIGARNDDTPGGADAGSAYVFVRSGTAWTEQQKLLASDGAATDQFGFSVSVSGGTAVVGARSDDTPGGADAGSAYVFVRSGTTWTEQQKLLASDGASNDRFGFSLSVSGETVVVGAYLDDTPFGMDAGAAYVFVRSGATWNEQQKLFAPDGAASDGFGVSVSLSGDTAVVGAYLDDTPGGTNAGSAHVFRGGLTATDVGVTKTDGQTSAVPGLPVTYTLIVTCGGPDPAIATSVVDTLPAMLTNVTWTCTASPGSFCPASGSGAIDHIVNVDVNGTLTYSLTGTVSPSATGTLVNSVTVTPPAGVTDPNTANNTATDVDTLTPEADLAITKTDSVDPVFPGDPLSYVLTITGGPSNATSVTAADTLPAGVTFVSSSPGPPTCDVAGVTVTCALGTLVGGGTTVVTINVTVNASTSGVLVNTATVSASEPDPNPANNSASATTTVIRGDGELAHGTDARHDLASLPGPLADEDVFRISQKPHSSYEVVVDGTSGDIGAGAGPFLERIDADGTTVLQDSRPIGTGSSRSLRWSNTTSAEVNAQRVRVRSASCETDCGPDDVYRIRAYETTYSVPRFNNAGTQMTVLVLQNPTNYPIAGEVYFRDAPGVMVAVQAFSLGPKTTLVLNTATIPGANGVSGAMTVAHNGRYGDLAGKTVALEPATGFSFDSALVPRLR